MQILQISAGNHVLIDDEDYEKVNEFKWQSFKIQNHKKTYIYAARRPKVNGKKTIVYLHRFILGVTDKKIVVDHIDGNTLNNQKNNLRLCEAYQNSQNFFFLKGKSKYMGVHRSGNTFRSRIRSLHTGINRIECGSFQTEEEAAHMYDKFALLIRGQFAKLNFPEKLNNYWQEIKENISFFEQKIKRKIILP